MSVHIYSKTEAGLLFIESEQQLATPQFRQADGAPVELPQLRQETLPDGKCRYMFEASSLQKWTPDTPVLYELQADGGIRERFGFMDLRPVSNTTILLNGSPLYVRGYIRGIVAHDHPNMTGGTLKDAAVKNIRQAKKYGFNLVRYHSTVPTPDFVEAADEEGLLIHLELGFHFESDDAGRRLIIFNNPWEETILRFRNHPSLAIFCLGNEMNRSGHFPEVGIKVEQGKALLPGKLVMDNSGWGEFDRQCADIFSQHIAYFFPYGKHREMFNLEDPWKLNGSAYDEPLDTNCAANGVQAKIHRTLVPAKPALAHEALHYIEIIDYEALTKKFRDFCQKVGPEYLAANGINHEPRFMSAVPQLIERKGLKPKMPDYIKGSEQFKMAAIKTYLERCRFSKMCGFEMLQFADCLKYEARNGIVDCFDDDKYIPAEWMRQFNADLVILADFPGETHYYGDTVKAAIYISDFLTQPAISGGSLRLSLRRTDGSEQTIYDGHNIVLAGGLQKVLDCSFSLEPQTQASQVEFAAEFSAGAFRQTNSWSLWFYPRPVFLNLPELRLKNEKLRSYLENTLAATDVTAILTDTFDEPVFSDLANGKDVVLLYNRDNPANQFYLPCALERCKPCIWDRGSNLGGIVYPEWLQNAMGSGKYFNLNWHALIEGGFKVCLDGFPCPVDEKVCGIDKPVRDRMKILAQHVKDFIDQDTLRNFSHLFSLRFEKSTLTVCSFSFSELQDPTVPSFLAALLNDREHRQASKSTVLADFRKFVEQKTVAPHMKEDVQNHFWELDNKIVEDTLFWEEVNLDLSKITFWSEG